MCKLRSWNYAARKRSSAIVARLLLLGLSQAVPNDSATPERAVSATPFNSEASPGSGPPAIGRPGSGLEPGLLYIAKVRWIESGLAS